MEDKRFDQPVELMTADAGGPPDVIGTAAQAASYLLKRWPAKPGPLHRKARQALVDLFEGTASPTQAREAFEAAADEAEIRIGGWHAKNPVAAFMMKHKPMTGAAVPRPKRK